jgi:hypothetical protein
LIDWRIDYTASASLGRRFRFLGFLELPLSPQIYQRRGYHTLYIYPFHLVKLIAEQALSAASFSLVGFNLNQLILKADGAFEFLKYGRRHP